MDEAKSTKKIDWNDPSVIRYHALKMKPKTVAQARRNMIKYLKNQGNYKISDFKGMSYNEIRPIFEKVWDFNQHIEPMEHGTEKIKSPEKMKSPKKMKSPEKMKSVGPCTNSSTAILPFLQNILDLYFNYFKLSEDVVNRILQVVLDLQHFKSSLFIFAAICVLTPVRGESLKILNGFDVSLPVSHSLWSSQSFGHQKAINGFDMPLPVAVCSGLVNPLAPRKGKFHGGLITMSTLCT
ncbi:hypothetical protein Tco_1019362 [Tanacetum coccineum]|uniref:Uncharacterized protein n=1 Tax=Tanacetum coccineum TaxID=301880 RepID=A0ABQ5FZA3_9ASTR